MAKRADSSPGDAQKPASNAKKASSTITTAKTSKKKANKTSSSEAARTQTYDNLLKRLVEHQTEAILPLLFPQLKILRLEELTIEMLVPPRRGDRVYKAYRQRSNGSVQAVILQVEYETGDNPKMDKRLHVYHAILYEKYELPVYSAAGLSVRGHRGHLADD